MNENDDDQVLEQLLAGAARKPFEFGAVFRLPSDVVLAFVRGIVVARPGVTPAQLLELAGGAGIPRSVVVRAARGEPAPVPIEKPTAWSRRTRLSDRVW